MSGPCSAGTMSRSRSPTVCWTERKHVAQVGVGLAAAIGQPPRLLTRRVAGPHLKREARQTDKPLMFRYVDYRSARPRTSEARISSAIRTIFSRHDTVPICQSVVPGASFWPTSLTRHGRPPGSTVNTVFDPVSTLGHVTPRLAVFHSWAAELKQMSGAAGPVLAGPMVTWPQLACGKAGCWLNRQMPAHPVTAASARTPPPRCRQRRPLDAAGTESGSGSLNA